MVEFRSTALQPLERQVDGEGDSATAEQGDREEIAARRGGVGRHQPVGMEANSVRAIEV